MALCPRRWIYIFTKYISPVPKSDALFHSGHLVASQAIEEANTRTRTRAYTYIHTCICAVQPLWNMVTTGDRWEGKTLAEGPTTNINGKQPLVPTHCKILKNAKGTCQIFYVFYSSELFR